MEKIFKYLILAVVFGVCLGVIAGSTGYASDAKQTVFLENVFQGSVPEPDYIWITPELRPVIESILIHAYKGLRIKYWRKKEQSVWVLDDMAKGKPVCAAFAVSMGKINALKILSAEGRWGSLVKNVDFTGQFINVASDENQRLTRQIDGISGATMSANAVSRLACLALALDKLIHGE